MGGREHQPASELGGPAAEPVVCAILEGVGHRPRGTMELR